MLLVAPRPPPLGGISVWTEAVLAGDAARRFEVTSFDTAPRDDAARPSDRRPRLARALRAPRLALAFRRRVRAERPALVHVATSYHWALLRDAAFVRAARAAGARVVLHLHGGDFPEMMDAAPPLLRRVGDDALAHAHRVVAITRDTEGWLAQRIGRGRVRYLPNFLPLSPPERTGSTAAAEGSGPTRMRVLFVGAVIEAKGVRELLAAAGDLPELALELVGPPDPAFVEAVGPELRALGARVRLRGAVAHEDMAAVYAGADVFALPSHREGFPLSLVEALAAGLPVVASAVGAIPEIVRDGEEGLLVPARDAAALAAALRKLAHDPALRRALAERGRARALGELGPEAGARGLVALWEEALQP